MIYRVLGNRKKDRIIRVLRLISTLIYILSLLNLIYSYKIFMQHLEKQYIQYNIKQFKGGNQ